MLSRISIDTDVCHGKPRIRGTRILISVVLALVEEGLNFDEISQEYPELSSEDIRAAIHYARLVVENEDILVASAGTL